MAAPTQTPSRHPVELAVLRSDYPALCQSASDTSRRGQLWYRRFITGNLFFLVAGAAFSGVASIALDSYLTPIFKALTVILLLCAMATNFVNWRRDDDKDWFDGRAVAESVKTATWRYMMRIEPFTIDATSDQEFALRLKAILNERIGLRQELGELSTDPHQISDRMREIRRLGVKKRHEIYVRERLDKQIRWYREKARLNARLADRWFWASFGAEFLSVLVALTAYIRWEIFELVGVIAALSVAFTAWTQLGRHNELNKSYGLAWQELLAIRDAAGSTKTEEALKDLVRAGEDAISREHTMWVAKHE